MQIESLGPNNQAAALSYLRTAPYRNALPLSNATQLRAHCDVLVASRAGRVLGVASTYYDLPIPNLTFACEAPAVSRALLTELALRNPPLRSAPSYALLPHERRNQLARFANILDEVIEYQMVVEPELLRVPAAPLARRLGEADLPAMGELAVAAGLAVWHAGALALGPAFGCFAGDQLVAMAATHFATPEIIEIGHVATHPDHRRQGYASACTAALTRAAFGLAARVFLMVVDQNSAAVATYRRLGFQPMERFHMVHYQLRLG